MKEGYYDPMIDEIKENQGYSGQPASNPFLQERQIQLPVSKRRELLPEFCGEFTLEVTENSAEIILEMSIRPDLEKKGIIFRLISPQLLEISGKRKKNLEKKRDIMAPHTQEPIIRLILLPNPVTEEGSMALFRNNLLMLHLKKLRKKKE